MDPSSIFKKPFPAPSCAIVSFPSPAILLITLNCPQQLNAITRAGHHELDALFQWMDDEPSIHVGIITGAGRAFCVGANLKEWHDLTPSQVRPIPESGFAGLARRSGRKPVIAAVNGLCLGGGCEAIINCDIVLAAAAAKFALPEVQRGLVPVGGSLPRLIRNIGRQRASEMVLTGRMVSAEEACQWGFVNRVVGAEELLDEAIRVALEVVRGSPDAVVVARRGLLLGWEGKGVDEASRTLIAEWWDGIKEGVNAQEGLRAFADKREPKWEASKL